MTSRGQQLPMGGIAVAVLLGIVVVGFAAGTRRTEYEPPIQVARTVPAVTRAEPARSYRELFARPWSERPETWAQEIAALDAAQPEGPSATAADLAAKERALAERAEHRAFDGAPPTIPHPVRQGAASECLACHATGVRLGDLVARPLSHQPFTSCTQCHVVEESPVPTRGPRAESLAPNTFAGVRAAPSPYRWTASAPPQMPHTTLMREACLSCHGPKGRPGLMTSHPDRQNCPQCHTPSASLDQRTVWP